MDPGKCPSCGTPLGSGMLAGQCPRCLLGGDPHVQSTGDVDAQKRSGGIAVLQASDGSGSGGDYAPPSSSAAAPPRSDRLDDIDPDSHRDADVRPAPRPDLAARPDPAATWSDRAPAPRIEGYEVLRELSQGGQGIVYLAVQRSTKRKVAVKVLLAGMFASKAARRRFEREVELVASLKHPNVIAVFDSGTTPDGHDFYVMDYVRGLPLTQYVRDKGLGLEDVLNLFATTCEAVNHAHLRGVIHRDLKPSNLLVDAEGNVRVLDFGLAKALIEPAESIVSVTGHVVGTFPYMSPEQTRANPDEVDTRTDVYALGVVLYEALTGKHPYPVTGNVADIVRHIVETPPSPPARTWSGGGGVRGHVGRHGRGARAPRCPIDPDLETILLKALSKERERRYDNAGHFARDLRRYLADEPIVARRPSAGYQLRLFTRRHRALVVASVGIFLVLVLGVIATTSVALKLRSANLLLTDGASKLRSANLLLTDGASKLRSANLRLTEASEAIGNFMAFGGDDRADNGDLLAASNLYLKALEETRAHGQSGSSILAGLVEIGTRAGGEVPLLGSYGGDYGTGVFRGHGAKPNNVAVLHKARRALTGGENGELILWDLVTGRRLASVRTHRIQYVTVTPDQEWALTAGDDGTVRRWRVDPLAEVETLVTAHAIKPDADGRIKTEPVWMVAVSHDGSRVLAGTNTGQIILRDADGTSRTIGECGGESAAGLAFLPGDARYALSGDHNNCIRLWDLEAGREVWKEPLQQRGQVNSVVFSPDEKYVATVSFGGTLVVWRAEGTGAEFRLKQRYDPIDVKAHLWRVAFSDDGKWIATAARGAGVSVYDAATGRLSRQFRAQKGDTMGVEFLDAETLVSTGDATLNVKGGMLNSALMLWDLRERPGVTVAGITGVSVEDNGDVRVDTPGGATHVYVGRDGALHPASQKEPDDGPAGRARGDDRRGGAKGPSWAEGGRSGPRPDDATSAKGTLQLCSLADGKVKLMGGAGTTLQLWGTPNAASGDPAGHPVLMRVLDGHAGTVTNAAISPNGRYIVSADATGRVLAWDLYRPLVGRDLERKLEAAIKQLEKNSADTGALSTLKEWFAFRGR